MPDPHEITLNEAAAMTKAYRDARLNEVKSSAFSREAFERILRQDGCAGIRTYHALTPDNKLTVVFVGYDSNGNDMVDGELAEAGNMCPPFCPLVNPLSTD